MNDKVGGFIEMQQQVVEQHAAELQNLKVEMEQREVLFQRKLEEYREKTKAEKRLLQDEVDRLSDEMESHYAFLEKAFSILSETEGLGFFGLSGRDKRASVASLKECRPRTLEILLSQAIETEYDYEAQKLVEVIAKHANTPPDCLRRINEQYDELDRSGFKDAAQFARKNPNFNKD